MWCHMRALLTPLWSRPYTLKHAPTRLGDTDLSTRVLMIPHIQTMKPCLLLPSGQTHCFHLKMTQMFIRVPNTPAIVFVRLFYSFSPPALKPSGAIRDPDPPNVVDRFHNSTTTQPNTTAQMVTIPFLLSSHKVDQIYWLGWSLEHIPQYLVILQRATLQLFFLLQSWLPGNVSTFQLLVFFLFSEFF